MIASILRHAGFRTGLYTSPHLIEPTERIQIDSTPVTPDQFVRAFEIVHECAEKMLRENRLDAHPSYFETVTAMALLIFHARCDISVMEVGLGGRLDATNVIHPELCVITPVAYDHEAFLGNTLESIAFEKAGILKSGIPVVLAKQAAAADVVITERADELGCPVIRASNIKLASTEASMRRSTFVVDGVNYTCALPGRHQIENAVAAILACRELHVNKAAIRAGLKGVEWPGRLELVSRNPDFVLDGAHNPAGAAALTAYIREFCANRSVWLVYGAMRDKAIEEVIGQLLPLAERVILTAPDFPRALRPEAILHLVSHPNAAVTHTVSEAVEIARSAPPDTIVFFTGSRFLVGEARALLLRRKYTVS
jgi:dihydrofolate synthase/folylpolyglutamate synthase